MKTFFFKLYGFVLKISITKTFYFFKNGVLAALFSLFYGKNLFP
ncbi:hypothetical protein HMPREF1391_01168 [Helicobacter pylori GAM100Ai]|uniref:Uncharacterized protein n=1 Tax=Helicobacter pylori GAM100Ai TaxID=1159019 RepID=A0AB72ZU51_HELPX|nr:hypothetical protein HMPREF1391_01168 [Helicobacter pylori GAM100Ai]